MLICLYIHDELSYDTQHKDRSQLYQVGTVFVRPDGETKTAATPYPVADALQIDLLVRIFRQQLRLK